ncbi:uncharacterized protein [Macrobrachium rosenbergii]|uniref:uncharacterized protein n=1 Tax=Macrobrachium rosenbergii TaxID=79674 RepID=UPI0034D71FAF
MGEAQRVEGPVVEIQDREVKKRALSKMKNGKAPGPSEFQIEMIKVLGHGLKVLERILDERLREIAKIGKQQYGFIVRQLQEKRLEGNQELYCAFIDLEKAYDRLPKEVMFCCLRKRKAPEKLARLVEMIFQGTSTRVITAVGETENFEVSVGVHQGSALSPFLFVLVMDVLSEEIRNEVLWELL